MKGIRNPSSYLLVLALIGLDGVALASDDYSVGWTTSQDITGPDGVCKTVTNYSSTGRMNYVPTNSVGEWQSFYTRPPQGVSLADCVAGGGGGGDGGWSSGGDGGDGGGGG